MDIEKILTEGIVFRGGKSKNERIWILKRY